MIRSRLFLRAGPIREREAYGRPAGGCHESTLR